MSDSASNKKKSSRASQPALIRSTARLALGPGRWLVLPAVALLLTAALLWFAWRQVRDDVLGGPQYQVTYDNIHLSPPPAWVRSDIKEQALRDASLDEPLSLLDPELPGRVARALELHPWVAKVDRVLPQYPAEIQVVLTYRKPVCMVELPAGYYPLDGNAILLPTGDFTVSEPKRFPQLKGITSPPLGPVGSRWDDPRVVGGAAVAATLVENWEPWKLSAIVPSDEADGGHNRDEHTYRLVTRAGTEIIWGHAPGREISPEPDAAGKIGQLARRFSESGSIDASPGEKPLDLRSIVVPISPRTAARP